MPNARAAAGAAAPSPPTSMRDVSAIVAAAGRPPALRERLEARYRAVLNTFQEEAGTLNMDADTRQMVRAQELKEGLERSHVETVALLEAEREMNAQHAAFLADYAQKCGNVPPGAILPPFHDEYHCLDDDLSAFITPAGIAGGGGNVGQVFAASEERMEAERLRVLHVAVALRGMCQTRMELITQCAAVMEEEEKRRRASTESALRELMLSLTKISYTSITGSHALAQRVIHSVNEEVANNYLSIKTLLYQLSHREVLKQQQYSSSMQALYADMLDGMARSHLWWTRTLLQSVQFRRPASRITFVERVHEVSAVARRDATHFLRSLSVVVKSLRTSFDSGSLIDQSRKRQTHVGSGHGGTGTAMQDGSKNEALTMKEPQSSSASHKSTLTAFTESSYATQCQLSCGGSAAAGWLRHYDPHVFNDVFPTDPTEVVDEWRMKADVVLRNSLFVCVALAEEIKKSERARSEATQQLKCALLQAMEWVFTPLEDEPSLLVQASVGAVETKEEDRPEETPGSVLGANEDLKQSADNVETNLSFHCGVIGFRVEDASVVDEGFQRFTYKGVASISQFHAEADSILDTCSHMIILEGEWFSATVERGLMQSHAFFQATVLSGFKSVLRTFDRATQELTTTATDALDFVRAFYRKRYGFCKDHEDALMGLEENFTQITDKLVHAGSTVAAEELFAVGLHCLEDIAVAHTQFHHSTVSELASIGVAVDTHAAACCRRLLELIGVESVEDTQVRLIADRQRKIEEATMLILQEQNANAKKKNKRGASQDEMSSTSSQHMTLSMLEDIPLEEVDYPQMTAPDGTVYNIVGPLALIQGEDPLEQQQQYPQDGCGALDNSASTTPRSNQYQPSISASKSSGGGIAKQMQPPMSITKQQTPSSSLTKRRGKNAQQNNTGNRSEAVSMPTLAPEFIESYEPCFADTILDKENFIGAADAEAWCQLVRQELLNWVVNLSTSTHNRLTTYCTANKNTIDKETNEILRYHRRRPAAFQADIYEARVRELENQSNSSEKYCTRLRERMSKVEAMWENLHGNPAYAKTDRKLLAELDDLREKIGKTPSLSQLQVYDRRFSVLCAQYVEFFEQRSHQVSDSVHKHRDLMETECKHYLAERAIDVAAEEFAEGVTLEQAIAQDPLSQRVRDILAQLQVTTQSVERYIAEEYAARTKMVGETKSKHTAEVNRNTSELQLLSRLQELSARLRTHVQSRILLSNADESRLDAAVAKLEDRLARSLPSVDLAAFLRAVVQRDYALDPAVAAAAAATDGTAKAATDSEVFTAGLDGLSKDAVLNAEGQLHERLRASKVQLQRFMHTSDAAELLRVLDKLREELYTRGASLSALTYAVELAKIAPEYYIEPKPLPLGPDAASPVAQAQASNLPGRGIGGKKQKLQGSKAQQPVTQTVQYEPLPSVPTIESQVREWMHTFKTDAITAVQAHFSAYPDPTAITRRLPGLEGGSLDDLRVFIDSLGQAQEQRTAEHIAEATRTYHRYVHRVQVALLKAPQHLAAHVYAVSAQYMQSRVEDVMNVFGAFYSQSSTLKTRNKKSVKVSLGNKYSRERLLELSKRESARQQMTDEALIRFWGLVLREVQDEAGMHVARCVNAANTMFLFLKGIVTPEHLIPCEVELDTGHHRGLKHLMKMRSQSDKLRDLDAAAGGGAAAKRERRLQETMPLLKHEGKTSARDRALVGDSGLLPPVYNEMDYAGIPLYTFKPLDAFSEAHPAFAIPPPISAGAYYPAGLETAASEPLAQPSSQRGGVRSGVAAGGKWRSVLETVEDAPVLSPSFVVPSTRVYQDTIALTRQSVNVLQAVAQEVVEEVDHSFDAWGQREAQWAQSWALTMDRLANGNVVSGSMDTANS